jgi:hypothetical protein
MLSRRMFLASSSAIAAAHLLPTLPASADQAATAAKPATKIWVGGHDGEFDWQPFNANTREEAIRQLFNSWEGVPPGDITEDILAEHGLCLQRAETMDGLQVDEIKGHNWIDAGLGCCCDRCGSECFAPDGARSINGEAICEECLTIADLLDSDEYDRRVAEERLTEWLMDHDCDEVSVREQMSSNFDPDLIPVDIWQKCLAEARSAV